MVARLPSLPWSLLYNLRTLKGDSNRTLKGDSNRDSCSTHLQGGEPKVDALTSASHSMVHHSIFTQLEDMTEAAIVAFQRDFNAIPSFRLG